MLRVRFEVDEEDYRPVKWPIKHPYWCSGYSDTHNILVAYVDDLDQLLELWPDAENVDIMEEDTEYSFTDRFPKPDWLKLEGESHDM